jgi:hypothetical protein
MAYTKQMADEDQKDEFFMGSNNPASNIGPGYGVNYPVTGSASIEMEEKCPNCGSNSIWHYQSGVVTRVVCEMDCKFGEEL